MTFRSLLALGAAALCIPATAQAAVEASAVATWQATAKKDTTSELVVTPLSSLSFQYAWNCNCSAYAPRFYQTFFG